MKNLKKFSQKDRYGNMISFEFEVPPMENQVPKFEDYFNHPGQPQGTDTVPAWLTPGERVMNAEAERMYGPVLAQMNDKGRAIQAAQGGTIPNYGPEPEYAAGGCKVKYAAEGELIPYPEVPTTPGTLSTEIPTPYDDYTINARRLLIDQEGYKTNPYQDHLGNWTVGAGHKIVDKDVLSKLNAGESVQYTPDQLMGYFEKDYDTALTGAKKNFKGFDQYPADLQHALISMNYQLGTEGTSEFEKMRGALEEGDWDKAVYEAGNSKWAKQTPVRAAYLQSQIEKMKDQDIPMSDSDAPIFGANGEQYNIDTLTASTNTPVVPPTNKTNIGATRSNASQYDDYVQEALKLGVMPKDRTESWWDHWSEIKSPMSIPVGEFGDLQKDIAQPPVPPKESSEIPLVTETATPVDEFSNITRDLQTEPETDVTPKISDGATFKSNKEAGKVDALIQEAIKKTKPPKVDDLQFDDGDLADTIEIKEAQSLLSQFGDNAQEFLTDAFNYVKDAVTNSGLLDQDELNRAALLYLGSRAMGYNHTGSGQFAIKNYLSRIEKNEAARKASAVKADERAFELYKEGLITPDQYKNFQAKGSFSQLLGGTGNKAKRKYTDYFKTGQAGTTQYIQGFVHPLMGNVYENEKGELIQFDPRNYTEYSNDIHDYSELSRSIASNMKDALPENIITESITDDDGRVTSKVNKVSIPGITSAYATHLNQLHGPKGYLYMATPEGQQHLEDIIRLGANYYDNNEGTKKVESEIGMINMLAAGRFEHETKIGSDLKATNTVVLEPLNDYVSSINKANPNAKVAPAMIVEKLLNIKSANNVEELKLLVESNPQKYPFSEADMITLNNLVVDFKTKVKSDNNFPPKGISEDMYFVRYYLDQRNK